jgi:inorganic pyrophosphatase
MKAGAAFHRLRETLDAGDGEDVYPVFIETPKGNRNKYKYEPELGLFTLGGVLPAGAVFPYDFGFVPYTLAPDGDPIDVLVFMDEPAFPGCLLSVRLIGVLEAKQTESGKTVRNDRLVGVAACSRDHAGLSSLGDIRKPLRKEIEKFFVDYNAQKDRKFRPIGWFGERRAKRLVAEARTKFKKHSQPSLPSPSAAFP